MTRPLPFQKEGVKLIHRKFNGRVILADEMGLGKTFSVLYYRKHYLSNKRPTIAVTPAFLKYNWQREAKIHFGIHAEICETRTPPSHRPLIRPHLLVINYDILPYWVDYLVKLRPEAVFLDEAHYLIDPNSLRTLACTHLCRKVPHVIPMTGTPMTNRPRDLFPILRILAPDKFRSPVSFGRRYCGAKWTPWGTTFNGATRKTQLRRKLKNKYMIRRKVKEVYKQLPPKRFHSVPVAITNRKEYNKAETEFLAWLAEKSPAKAARARKTVHRVKSGYLRRLIADLKTQSVIKWIDTFLAQSDEKLIVFGLHIKFLHALREAFDGRCYYVDGSVQNKKRDKIIQQFQKSKRRHLLLAQMKAVGIGANITAASKVAIAEFPWVPADIDQAIARAARIGQKKIVDVYFLLGANTIEEKVCRIIDSKRKVINEIIDGERDAVEFDVLEALHDEIFGDQTRKRKSRITFSTRTLQ